MRARNLDHRGISVRRGLRPVVDAVLPLAQTAEAHRWLEAGDHLGKIVRTVDRS